jgi:hypothetical protein
MAATPMAAEQVDFDSEDTVVDGAAVEVFVFQGAEDSLDDAVGLWGLYAGAKP